MYATRPLRSVESLFRLPEGPFSGYLLLQNEEEQDLEPSVETCCWGLYKDKRFTGPPFPQNKCLSVCFTDSAGETTVNHVDHTFFIPVLGQPLTYNLYYVVAVDGKHKGLVCTCSREEEKVTSCFCTFVEDTKPKPFHPNNIYQQMQIIPRGKICKDFISTSVASDGYPPRFLRRNGWEVFISKSKSLKLSKAEGMNVDLRAQFPHMNFPISQKGSKIVTVGEWYSPFIFVKEKGGLDKPKKQLKESFYYKMSLEQQWEEIHCCRGFGSKAVGVETRVKSEEGFLMGRVVVDERWDITNGMVWFETREKSGVQGGLMGVGLSKVIMEKMKWDQDILGNRGEKKDVKVERVFHSSREGEWTFALYVLVERYVLRRMDESLIFSYVFRHSQQLREKWE
ncbi:hypothetical protein AMTRI_Chr10g230820 [Amborella trichopoda]|uniref:Uncharacterized protein n=1 Tax=Amborella trichopoda TaxID=13333 RepID=W1NXV4_AMBTC|nr:uncharacterized protein LOC18427559 [Amborella trichopoda]ERM99524.1 hypothetical protein AMTR_s00088p00063810 [Amborella trichopoda]|eukprot:XP_006836671.1 uncharacterized protein LOC18427559 [Amborella trichopoda]